MPGMSSRMKNVGMRLGKPPNSAAEEEGWAPSSRMLSATAVRVTTMGSRSAAAYHCTPTRQRTIRRSNSTTPVLPRVIANTINAATKGPGAMGVGARSRAYRGQPHHESAQASTKNVMSGYLLTDDKRYSPLLASHPLAGHPSPTATWAGRSHLATGSWSRRYLHSHFATSG